MELIKNIGERINRGGPTCYTKGWRVRPLPCAFPEPPPTLTPTPYILFWGEKNQGEGFITFYDTEPPPPPILHQEGRSGVRSGLRRGENDAVVIINHPPSPIS